MAWLHFGFAIRANWHFGFFVHILSLFEKQGKVKGYFDPKCLISGHYQGYFYFN